MGCSFCGEETVRDDHRYGYECQLSLSNRIVTLYRRIRAQDEEIKKLKKLVQQLQAAEIKDVGRPTMESVLREEETLALQGLQDVVWKALAENGVGVNVRRSVQLALSKLGKGVDR